MDLQSRAEMPPRPSRVEDTIFQLIVWFWVEARSVNEIARDLGFSPRTVHGYMRKIRTLIEKSNPIYSGQLDGRVYLDTWTYRPKFTSDGPKRPVLLGIMSAGGDLRLFTIPARKPEFIHELVKAHVKRNSTLIFDRSNIYLGLQVDGFPKPEIKSKADLIGMARSRPPQINLCTIWDKITAEMNQSRGVRSNNFLPRVREIELRWRFRKLPKIYLYQHVIDLSRP